MKAPPSNPFQGENISPSLAFASQTNAPHRTDEAIEAIGRRTVALAQTGRCAIFLRQRDGVYTCPWSLGLSPGFVQKILAEAVHSPLKDYFFGSRSGPLVIPDTRKALATSALTALSREEEYRAVTIWPVHSRGKTIAAITCFYNKPHTPAKADQKSLVQFLRQAGSVLETAVPEVEQRPSAVLNGLYDLSRQLVASDTLEILMERFVQSAVEIVQASFARVITRERDGAFLCQAAYPPRPLGAAKGQAEPQAAQLVYHRIVRAEAPFLLRHSDVTLGYEARIALGLDTAHTLCLVPLRVDAEVVGLLVLGEERLNESFHTEKQRLAAMIADLMASVIHRERLYRQLEDSYLDTILALTRSLEYRDQYTGRHSSRMVELAERTGRQLGMSSGRLQAISWAARLHDIGKIGVPDDILNRPGPLTDEDWEIMRQHPRIGSEIISPISSLAHVAPFIRAHHEHFDGSGYPDHLKGEEIPLEARIITVVDAYCAMTDGRIYRPAKSQPEAVAELLRCSGTQFDPLLVEVFINLIEKN